MLSCSVLPAVLSFRKMIFVEKSQKGKASGNPVHNSSELSNSVQSATQPIPHKGGLRSCVRKQTSSQRLDYPDEQQMSRMMTGQGHPQLTSIQLFPKMFPCQQCCNEWIVRRQLYLASEPRPMPTVTAPMMLARVDWASVPRPMSGHTSADRCWL